MADFVTFDAYLRYVRWQSSPAEARAVRAWLIRPAHAAQAHSWMQQYAALLLQEADQNSPEPDFDAIQDTLLARLQLGPSAAHQRYQANGLTRIICRCFFPLQTQEFLGLRAFFHRLHWQ
jgi:hypothetical protein